MKHHSLLKLFCMFIVMLFIGCKNNQQPADSTPVQASSTFVDTAGGNNVVVNPDLDKPIIQSYSVNKPSLPTPKRTTIPKKNNTPLTIIDYAPVDELPADVTNPEIYLLFSTPIQALQALDEEVNPPITITPPLKGQWRWVNSNLISFESTDMILPQRQYTVTVDQELTALNGQKLGENFSFNFNTEPLSMTGFEIGYNYKGENRSFSNNNVPPEFARFLAINFNYEVDSEFLKHHIQVMANGRPLPFMATQTGNLKRMALTLTAPPPFDKKIDIVLTQGAASNKESLGRPTSQSYSFNTMNRYVKSDS